LVAFLAGFRRFVDFLADFRFFGAAFLRVVFRRAAFLADFLLFAAIENVVRTYFDLIRPTPIHIWSVCLIIVLYARTNNVKIKIVWINNM